MSNNPFQPSSLLPDVNASTGRRQGVAIGLAAVTTVIALVEVVVCLTTVPKFEQIFLELQLRLSGLTWVVLRCGMVASSVFLVLAVLHLIATAQRWPRVGSLAAAIWMLVAVLAMMAMLVGGLFQPLIAITTGLSGNQQPGP